MSNGLCLHSQDILLVPVTAVKPINMFPPQHPENLLAFAKTLTMENGDVTLVQRDSQLDSQTKRGRVEVFDKTLHFLQCAEMK